MAEYMRLDTGSCLVTCSLKSKRTVEKHLQRLLSIPKAYGLINAVGSWLMFGYMLSEF